MNDHEVEVKTNLMRLIRERLEPFNVPNEIQLGLREEIFILFATQAMKKPFGACVMTPEASMAADPNNPMRGEVTNLSAKPKII